MKRFYVDIDDQSFFYWIENTKRTDYHNNIIVDSYIVHKDNSYEDSGYLDTLDKCYEYIEKQITENLKKIFLYNKTAAKKCENNINMLKEGGIDIFKQEK